MPRSQIRPAGVVLAALVIAGLGMLVPVVADGAVPDATDREQGASVLMSENESAVEIDVDCTRNSVELTAPEGYQYDVTVTVANVTPTANDVSRSTRGSVEGNATVDFDEQGIVFTAVQNQSGGEVTDVTDCTDDERLNTTVRSNETDVEVDVDCEENAVQFAAPEGTEYVGKVAVVGVSPTGTSTSSTTGTFEGNATESVDDGGLVVVFASTGELGDERTVSAIRNCSSWGTDANETEST